MSQASQVAENCTVNAKRTDPMSLPSNRFARSPTMVGVLLLTITPSGGNREKGGKSGVRHDVISLTVKTQTLCSYSSSNHQRLYWTIEFPVMSRVIWCHFWFSVVTHVTNICHRIQVVICFNLHSVLLMWFLNNQNTQCGKRWNSYRIECPFNISYLQNMSVSY